MRREKVVANHMARLKARPRQLEVDPECLRWTPVIVTNTVVSESDREDEEEEEEEEEEQEDDIQKEVDMTICWSNLQGFSLHFQYSSFNLFGVTLNRSNQATSCKRPPGICSRAQMKKRPMVSWGFPYAKALRLPPLSTGRPQSRMQHILLCQQTVSAGRGAVRPKTVPGAK